MSKQPKRSWIYFLMILISGLVAVYDNVLNVIFAGFLPEMEQNPVASQIIVHGGVPLFVQIKAVGTILATAVMCRLVHTRYRVSIISVFAIQLLLFSYLTFYTADGLFVTDDMLEPVKMFFEFYRGNVSWHDG